MIRRTREKALCLCNNIDQWPGPSPTLSSSLPSPPLLVLVVLHTHMTLPQSPSHRHIRTYWQEIIVLRWCPCRSWLFPPSSTPMYYCPPPWCPPPSCCPPTSPPSCPPHPWITSIPFAAIGWKQTITYGTKNNTFFANDFVDQNTTFFFSSSFPSSLVMAINLNKLAVWTSYNAWFWSKGKKTTLSLSFILFIQNGWTDLFPLCDWSMI